MGLSTAIYTVDNVIIGESSSGSRLDYLTDALGSVTAKVDQGATIVSGARYKPYGTILAGSDYSFGWLGSRGYRNSTGSLYIRARTYLPTEGTWTSIDALWPNESPYGYCNGEPVALMDMYGTEVITRTWANGQHFKVGCGIYLVEWKYSVASSGKNKPTGWLVQKVHNICDGKTRCNGQKLKCCPDYYEAWAVYKGNIFIRFNNKWIATPKGYAHDTFSNDAAGACTKGYDGTTGQLMFIPADFQDPSKNSIPPPFGLSYSNPDTCAGDLPSGSSFSKPDGKEWTNEANVFVFWACCKDNKSRWCFPPNSNCNHCPDLGPCVRDIGALTYEGGTFYAESE